MFMFICNVSGGGVGHPEAGSAQVLQQVRWHLQRGQQAQALHSHGSDWLPARRLPGEVISRGGVVCPLT